MTNSFEKIYIVTQNELNKFDDLSVCGILDYFQDIAGRHAEQNNIGYLGTNSQGINWILARTRFEIVGTRNYLDDIVVKTWPNKPGRFEVERNYLITDKNARTIVKGSSTWVLVNTKTKTLAPSSLIYKDKDEFISDKLFSNKLSSLVIDQTKFNKSYSFVVKENMLDHNMHMNNSRYGEEFINAICIKELYKVKYFEINYVKESKLFDELVIKYYIENHTINGIFYCNNEIRAKALLIIE